jgi:LysM repeat protein
MKQSVHAPILALFCTLTTLEAQQPDPRQLGVLDEKVSRLSAQVEDLQFQQQKTQKDLESLRAELQEVRRAGGGANSADLKALEDRINAVDAARQADKRAIIDQLAKELAGMSSGKFAGKPAPADAKEHTVVKGETLSAIAKTYGVTVADLKKANNLTTDDLKVGQKLLIPR